MEVLIFMYFSNDNNHKRVSDITFTIKLLTLLLSASIITINLLRKIWTPTFISIYLYITELIALSIILFFILWLLYSRLFFKKNNTWNYEIFESYIYAALYTALMIFFGMDLYQLNFIFLLFIISTTLQLGMKHGITIVSISSIIILLKDLFCFNNLGISQYLINDLIIIGSFLLTVWTLGHYVDLKENKINEKNNELKSLKDKFRIENFQREYIEEILINNDACYNLLIENSVGAIFVHHNDKILFANESAMRLVGIEDKKKLGSRSFLSFVSIDDKINIKKIFKNLYNEKKGSSVSECKISNGNKLINIKNTSSYFNYKGKPAIISILYDISKDKQVEQLTQDIEKNEALLSKSKEFNNSIIELFSNISHELKTPLTVIFSALQVINLRYKNIDDSDSKTKYYLDIMKQNCYRLMRLINNFLDITKLDSGFVKLNVANYDIVQIIEDITLSVVPYVESKNIGITFDTNVEEKIMAFDADKIERIMLNLLSNSVKYSRVAGEIMVTLTDLGDKLSISIKDTGLGIPENKSKLVFERFGQVDRTLKRVSEGTGIGLSLVKSFVEMHEGSIELKSEVGKGSEFIILLPVKSVPDSPKQDKPLDDSNIERINIEFSDIYTEDSGHA